MSQRPTGTRQVNKVDDPWCLICGVNLALDGRTYTTISRTQNGELNDVFSRVLGVKLSKCYGSVYLCNKCERQLKRLGRYSSAALARQEGKKLREQLEKNLVKHGQNAVEFEDVQSPQNSTSKVTKFTGDDYSSSVDSLKKAQILDSNSSPSCVREHSSRSSSVHFEEDREIRVKGSFIRTHSVPDRNTKKTMLSSAGEVNRTKEIRHGNRSSVSYTSDERAPSFRASSVDRKSSVTVRGALQRSTITRDANRSSQKSNVSDHRMKAGKPTTVIDANRRDRSGTRVDSKGNSPIVKSPTSALKKDRNDEKDEDSPDKTSLFDAVDQSANVARYFDTDNTFDDEVLDKKADEFDHPPSELQTMPSESNRQAVEEVFTKRERVRFKDSPLTSELSHDAEIDPARFSDDLLSSFSSTEEKPQLIKDQDETSAAESSQELTYDDDKDQTGHSQHIFQENTVDSWDTHDGPHSITTIMSVHPDTLASETTQNNKGKLSKYESLDLDIDNNNPFYDDVYCEYNRRVHVSRRIMKIDPFSVNKNGSHKAGTILEESPDDEVRPAQEENSPFNINIDVVSISSRVKDDLVASSKDENLDEVQSSASSQDSQESQKKVYLEALSDSVTGDAIVSQCFTPATGLMHHILHHLTEGPLDPLFFFL